MESMNAINVCIICSQAFCSSKRIAVEDVLKLLQFLFAKINCSALRNMQICESCFENVNGAYNFKTLFVEKMSANVAIKIEQINRELSICHICKEIVKNSSFISNTKVLDVIDYLSEEMPMGLQSTEDSHVCLSCQESIVNFHLVVQLLSNIDESNKYNPNVKIEQLVDPIEIEINEEPLMEYANIVNENSIVENEPLRMENIDCNIKTELTHENEVNLTYEDFIMKNEEVDIKSECGESDFTKQMWKESEERDKINPRNVTVKQFTIDHKSNKKPSRICNIYNTTDILKFACDICDYTAKEKGTLKRHMLIHKSIDEIEMCACDVCDYKTKRKGDLKKHILKHKSVDKIEMFSCDVCDYKAKRKEHLKKHMLKHRNVDEIEMFTCNVCDYKAKRTENLKKHMLKHKSVNDLEMFTCDVCGYKAKHKQSIKSHMLTHMSVDEIPIFACDVCDYKAKEKRTLKRHIMLKHKSVDEIEMFACDVCDYKAKQKGDLKKHMLIHKNVDEIAMFTCDVCDYKSKRKGYLKMHMLKHKNVDENEMFACDVCDHKTKYKTNIKRHTLKHVC